MPEDHDQLARDLIGCFPVLDKSDRTVADAWPGPTELAAWARRVQAVVDAAQMRAQVLRDLREFGSGSDGWAERDRLSDAAILAAIDALEAPVPP